MLASAKNKKVFRILGVLVGFSVFSAPAAESIYKWVDEDGNVSYSDQPPRQVAKAEELSIDSVANDDVVREAQEKRISLRTQLQTSQDQQSAASEQKRVQTESEQVVRDDRRRRCTNAREQIQNLDHHMPIYYIDETGNRVFLDDKNRADLIELYQREIKMFCE